MLAAAAGLTVLAALLALLPLRAAILLALSGAGAIVILRWPWMAWLLPAAALPIASSVRFGPISATELLIALAAWMWLAAGAARRSLRTTHHPILIPLLIYVLVLNLSLLNAQDLGEAAKEMVKWVEFAGVLSILPSVLTPGRARWMAAALLLAAIGQALIGLYQFVFQVGPEWFVLYDRFMRASGSFRQPNPFAGYLGLTLPIALSLSLWGMQSLLSKRASLAGIAWASLYLVATGLIAAGLLASWSRGAWLGAAAGALTVMIVHSRRSALLVAAVTLVLLVAALLGTLNPAWIPGNVAARFQDLPAYFGFVDVLNQPVTDENFAVLERLAHWVAALRMFVLAPWLGVGPGNYEAVYPAVRLPLWEEPLGHAHNIYLNVLAETGVIGFAAFLILWGTAVAWVWRGTRAAAWPGRHRAWGRALAAGLLGVLAHLAVHSLFDNLFVQGIYLHLAFWFALLAAAQGSSAAGQSESEAFTC